MSDQLLPHYNAELAFFRKMSGDFADAHPREAGALKISPTAPADPFVERMIEGFAYLNARTRQKIEDEFPEITDAMLGVLYPHYLAPVPSMGIMQFTLDKGQADLVTGYEVARGATLESEPVEDDPCTFRTCYPVRLWPVELQQASLGLLSTAPVTPRSAQASAVLRMQLKCYSNDMVFAKLQMPAMRFFLKGLPQHINALYELLCREVVDVAIATNPKDPRPVVLGPNALKPVGFERDEGMLPYTAQSFRGYRLLTELFTFPEKFHFIELTGLSPRLLTGLGNRAEVFIYLKQSLPELEQNVSADTFRLGCTPMVNLFPKTADPITLTQTQSKYHVVPDARRPSTYEIFSIDRVSVASRRGDPVEYKPFYSFRHAADRLQETSFWYASRRPGARVRGAAAEGTEMDLHLVDLKFDPALPADGSAVVEATCLNRDRPQHLTPRGRWTLVGGGPLSKIECLAGPTPTRRPPLKRGGMWRLISHLTLNHLSLVEGEQGADAMREILALYDFTDSPDTRAKISGLSSIRSQRVTRRAGSKDINGGLCRGLEVIAEFDKEKFTDNSLFLIASVLERFMGLYASINSFTELVLRVKQRPEEVHRWLPRAADKVLL